MRILLVEDHQPLVRALRQGLEEEGFAVDVATDGEEADVKCRSTSYDVIVLDVMLPKLDGLTLLKNWRQAVDKGKKAVADWHERFDAYKKEFPELAAQYERQTAMELPKDWHSEQDEAFPRRRR